MCRLFGFRSIIHSQVHQSLIHADNALTIQSKQHPDGWGVAYYLLSTPHVIRSTKTAVEDRLFQKVSGVVASQTVLAHLRRSTVGDNDILNTHPFQHGRWVFAHNGTIHAFEKHRENLLKTLDPKFKNFILGETDSELIFYFLLTHIEKTISLDEHDCPIELLSKTILEALNHLKNIIGEFAQEEHSKQANFVSFILTNGDVMIAHQGGKMLHYSTHKKRCSIRDACKHFAHACEHPTKTGYINHIIFSSEPLSGENIWYPMASGDLIGVDRWMQVYSQTKSKG